MAISGRYGKTLRRSRLSSLLTIGLTLVVFATPPAQAQDALDRLGDALTVTAFQGNARARLSGLLDLEGYSFEHPAPGLIDSTQTFLFNPRLTLFLDAQFGPAFYFFGQARLDRGFDPGDRGPRLRLDEYALRWTPWKDGRLNVQFGKAATVFGVWTGRHLSWDNPFVNAPLPYENVLPASDLEAPKSGSGFERIEAEEKYEYVPVVWGPSYTTGLTVSGRAGGVEYAVEVKNAALSSRPESWSATAVDFSHPAVSARLGYRPDLAWNFGVSFGSGAYIRPEVESELPAGRGIGNYHETVFGQDVSYAVGHWQLWAEIMESRFELPLAGRLDTLSYFLEAKYKFTPRFFGALRWNQQIITRQPESYAGYDTKRIDAALGYRFTEHLQLKLQYSFQDGTFSNSGQGSTVYTQLTLRF